MGANCDTYGQPVNSLRHRFVIFIFENPVELFTTLYGQTMLLKLIFVVTILSIAVYHKFHLVEEIQQEAGIKKFQKSITNEMIIAVMILAVTATLSSLLGPVSLI